MDDYPVENPCTSIEASPTSRWSGAQYALFAAIYADDSITDLMNE
ncbi:hypothetical protein [Microbacterium ulmi]|nr:hypothetical protein [Microbacterium ulmi]NII68404.1 hypothetical protein [Microbacterium ulmi]